MFKPTTEVQGSAWQGWMENNKNKHNPKVILFSSHVGGSQMCSGNRRATGPGKTGTTACVQVPVVVKDRAIRSCCVSDSLR